ncbi:MAG TPA: redox-sensing transcriptional repressor Rex [Anaerolineae bacterium]|nr:redox-sensing transcriptional repressor Rex [Anaerolineae bacterium]
MVTNKPVPDIVVGRLPIYLRALRRFQEEACITISSADLARRLAIGSAQIRKDLSHFGEFGRQGRGYDVSRLTTELSRILKVDREWGMALVGAGDLGSAISQYAGFRARGFRVKCVFDKDPAKIGRRFADLEVLGMEHLLAQVAALSIRVAIVAVPADEAQAVVNDLVAAGIRAILNYAPISIAVPPGVSIQHIDPVVHLQRMTYYLE